MKFGTEHLKKYIKYSKALSHHFRVKSKNNKKVKMNGKNY